MRSSFVLLFLLTLPVCAQSPAKPQAEKEKPQSEKDEIPPDTVVAVVNGRKMTAADVQKMVRGTPSQAQEAFKRDPKQFMQNYAWYMNLLDLAEENKLDEKSPYKEQLEYWRMAILAQAQVDTITRDVRVTAEQQKAHYEANQGKYKEARVKLIYLPFSSTVLMKDSGSGKKSMLEEEAKKKAEEIVRQARAGADFVKLVEEHSEDQSSKTAKGDFAMGVRATTEQVPAPMREAIVALGPGEISDPVRHQNGFYIFKAESAGVLPYDKVKDEIYIELKNAGFQEWQQKTRAESSVQFTNEDFFQKVPAAQ